MIDGQERTFLTRQYLVVHSTRIEAVLGIAGEVARAEHAEDFLHREDAEIVDLSAGIKKRIAEVPPVLEQHIGKPIDRFFIRDRFSFASRGVK